MLAFYLPSIPFCVLTMAPRYFLLAFTFQIVAAMDLGDLIPQKVGARSALAGGGWSLSSLSCPSDAPLCGASWCCPSSHTCIHTAHGMSSNVCCPGSE